MRDQSRSFQARSFVLLSLLLALLFLAVPSWADILVTQDGQRIETDGPWEVKGRQVVFTTASGILSAVRLSEIDLEASELATNPPEPEVAEVARRDEEPSLGEMSQLCAAGSYVEYTVWMAEYDGSGGGRST